MPRTYATHIRSNIKTGVDVGLADKVLIVGPNESGKSAVTDAFQLALFGFVPNVGGKDRAQPGPLMGLAPGLEGQLFAEVTFSDGAKASWSTTGHLNKAKAAETAAPPWLKPGAVIDMRDIRKQLVEAGDDARRRWLLQHATVHLTEKDLLDRIPARFHKAWPTVRPAAITSWGDGLIKAREVTHAKLLATRKEKAEAEGVLSGITAALGAAPLEGEIQQAAEMEAKWQAWVARVRAAVAGRERKAQMARNLESIHRRIAQLHSEIHLERPKYDPDTAMRLRALLIITERQAEMKAHGYQLDQCSVCGGAYTDQSVAWARGIVASIDRGALATQVAQEAAVLAKQNQIAALEEELAKVKAGIDAVELDGGVDDTWTVDRALKEAQAASKALGDLQSRASQSDRILAVKKRFEDAEENAALYEGLEDALDKLIPEVLARGVRSFEERVQRYLYLGEEEQPGPEGAKRPASQFRVLLEFKGAQACLIGLERAGQMHVFLSGSAWDRVNLAIGCALAEEFEAAFLLGEDVAYDPNMLAHTMRALAQAPAQILLTSPIGPSGRTPKGWLILDSAELRSAKPAPEGLGPVAPKKERKKKEKKEDKPKGPPGTETEDDDDQDDDGADAENSNEAEAPPSAEPPIDAPDWVLRRGHCAWMGVIRLDGTTEGLEGLDFEAAWTAKQMGDGTLVAEYEDTSNHQKYRLFAGGAVVRKFGQRLFLYRPPEDWGKKLWEGNLADLREHATRLFGLMPDVKQHLPISRGVRWYLTNGGYVWQLGERVSIWSGTAAVQQAIGGGDA